MDKNTFYQKIKFKYRLSILNENTLEEISHFRLSLLNIFLFVFSIAILYFFFIAFLIIKTPLRTFLPGYSDNIVLRKQLLLDAVQMDSLSQIVQENTTYIQTIQKVLSNDISVDSTSNIKLLTEQEKTKYKLDASSKEEDFRQKYEEAEKVNVIVVKNSETHNFLTTAPAHGIIKQKYNPSYGNQGITINCKTKESVYSILDGFVIFSGYSTDNYYVIQIQHIDNLISIYKTKEPFIKKAGEQVHSGEILTTFLSENSEHDLIFELWKSGKTVNPEEFITFN